LTPLARSFYSRPTIEVARELLGKIIEHEKCSGRIVETEAYLGEGDLAAHSAHGPTARTRVIFGPPGHAYVYFIYGMYECLNLIAEPPGVAGCVLIRALEPLGGIEQMRERRPAARRVEDLANGPGKLTRALAIKLKHNGADLTRGPIRVFVDENPPRFEIGVSSRIGITKSADLPLRFYVRGSAFVSRRPSVG
jgi:DNA-3-methyladenine glycosylase